MRGKFLEQLEKEISPEEVEELCKIPIGVGQQADRMHPDELRYFSRRNKFICYRL